MCELAAGMINFEFFKDFKKYVSEPTTLRLRGGASGPALDASKPKTIIKGAKIWTADDRNPYAEALAISETGRVLAVGSEASVMTISGASEAEIFDLTGRTILPGFVEPHMHPTTGAVIEATYLDLYPFTVTSKNDAIARLKAKCDEMDKAGRPNTEWVWGFGYDQALTPPSQPLYIEDLDKVSTTRPIFVISNTIHTGYANSVAFSFRSITPSSPALPGGGEFLKHPDGSLSGVMVESALSVFMSEQTKLSAEEYSQALINSLMKAVRKGVTTVVDAAVGFAEGSLDGQIGGVLHLAASNLLPCLSRSPPRTASSRTPSPSNLNSANNAPLGTSCTSPTRTWSPSTP